MRRLLVLGLILIMGVLIVTPALAGWFWNAQLEVEDAEVHLVWSVDDPDGANSYQAVIGLRYPKGADVELISTLTDRERVHLTPSPKLAITEKGVQVQAEFRIIPLKGADGTTATVSIVADGKELATASGALGSNIVLSATVPTD